MRSKRMKKGQIAEGNVTTVEFPNKGIVMTDEGERVIVKNTIPGQRVSFAVNKVRKGKAEGRLLETVKKSPRETADTCRHFGQCGGCTYQSLPYEEQLKIKETQVRGMIEQTIGDACAYEFLPIRHSPRVLAYRNKMEFSFGDEYKDGPLALGMHKRGSFYDIVTVEDCRIVDGDFRAILMATLAYFREQEIFFYHRLRHTGYLRHLLVRKAVKTGEILVDLITTTQDWRNVQEQAPDERAKIEAALLEKQGRCPHAGTVNEEKEKQLLAGWKDVLLALSLEGTLKGVLHTKNDSVADVVKNEGTEVLFGQDYFYEELLGLRFQISPFSFFQTNSLGAEVLYSTAREFILGDNPDMLADKTVYDLYSGTGTIAQMLAPVCKKVVGVEIIEEAVEAAKENAALNHLDNCEFLAGDVLKVLDTIEERPDYIVLDPPRDGIHPKALEKIINYGVDHMIYISCKPTSLARDLEVLLARGYVVDKVQCVDMFPNTVHVETVVLLSKGMIDSRKVKVDFSLEEYITSDALENEYNDENPFDATKIPLDDKKVLSLFHDTSALGIKPEDIDGCNLGCLGIPEFGTDFVIQMVQDANPQSLSDLIRISGLSHGTNVWLGNAQVLIESGKATISTAICTRDDIMIYLINQGVDSALSFTIMESVRKGKGLKPEWEETMKEKDVPDWYIWSCKQISYMFPKAHAAAYVMMAYRIAYCKINYPLAYYGAYFGIRADAFSYAIMCQGKDKLNYYMKDYKKRSDTLTKKEQDVMKDMKIVQEMYARGLEFMPIDIYRAKAKMFQIIDGKLMPSLATT